MGGETALTVNCLGCYHQAVKTFEQLKLWKDMILVDVPQHRRLVLQSVRRPENQGDADLPPARGTPGYLSGV
jgi:hypothetical protein